MLSETEGFGCQCSGFSAAAGLKNLLGTRRAACLIEKRNFEKANIEA
jgi:hypothetical protein